jgi:hypothetical protein
MDCGLSLVSLLRLLCCLGLSLILFGPTAWLNILASAAEQGIVGINGVLLDHYKKYGRTFFSR